LSGDQVNPAIAEIEGPAALPRKNGELVFAAPWESRAFAIAVALSGEVYEWEDFRRELIERIAEWEADPERSEDEWSYYERWLAGLESLLIARGVISQGELDDRSARIADFEAHEHDHPHDHGRDATR
jgi:nitrile hydratase accessory protein